MSASPVENAVQERKRWMKWSGTEKEKHGIIEIIKEDVMRAAAYYGKKDIRMGELETPVAGENDIVVRNIYSSICGTDVAVYTHGPNTGHRVTVGGFSEYVLIPNAELNKQVYAVSDKIPSKVASLIEPFTVGCRAARRSFPKPGEKAIVFGAGTIGIAAGIALQYFGCEKVMICDYSDFRLEKAAELGFAICNNKNENLKEEAVRYFGEAPSLNGPTADVDIYIDAAGAESILELYQEMGKIECRMVVVAVLAGKRPVDILSMTFAQHALIGSGGYFPEDVLDVMQIMESGRWDIGSIITHEYPWEKLPEAIEKASRVDEALNVVIYY